MDSEEAKGQSTVAQETALPVAAPQEPAKPRVVGAAAKPQPAAAAKAAPAPARNPKTAAKPVGPAGAKPVTEAPLLPPATAARLKRRHRVAATSFVMFVILPLLLLAAYLMFFAQNQFGSSAGFSVRKSEEQSSVESIGGLSQLTGSISTDAEILYDFILSQDLVQSIDRKLDLKSIYGRNHATDPLFSLKPDAKIEDKRDYWHRIVTVEYNEATGLISLEVRAFTPDEAQIVGKEIIRESSDMINRLAIAAREDATRNAIGELERAVERLKEVREAITEYRSRTQVVDPLIDIQGQMGLMTTLQGQLAEALIEQDLLNDFANDGDPRVAQVQRRIEVIEKRIADEKLKFGIGAQGPADGVNYASIVAEYERLLVDRQVAEEAFRAATLNLDLARTKADQQSRYLAAHVQPTLAEGAIYPRSVLIMAVTTVLLLLAWATAILVYYSIRDRR